MSGVRALYSVSQIVIVRAVEQIHQIRATVNYYGYLAGVSAVR